MLKGLLGADGGVGELIDTAGMMWLLKNSRDDEYEADALGTNYMAKSGYDPHAVGAFLQSLELQTKLHSLVAGQDYDPNKVDYFATHPNTLTRVARAKEVAEQTGLQPGELPSRDDEYLDRIDGMLYGDAPEQGYVRGRNFMHPDLHLAFRMPDGYQIMNMPYAVTGSRDNVQVKFDLNKNTSDEDMTRHLRIWAKGQRLSELQTGSINGMAAASALVRDVETQAGAADAWLYAIAFSDEDVAQFVVTGPSHLTIETEELAHELANSFRRLSKLEARLIKPLRLQVVQVRSGDTVDDIAGRMPFDAHNVDRFLTLNRIEKGQALTPGQRVKIITED